MAELTVAQRGNRLLKRYKGCRDKGKQVIDELCECGHQRSHHLERFDSGHGFCIDCSCRQFTWMKFITA